MGERRPVICVCSIDTTAAAWECRNGECGVSVVNDLGTLVAAMCRGADARGDEIRAIVLDRSVSADQLLHVLSRVPIDFRGDVVRIDKDGSATLSTRALRGGRMLYRLEPHDIAFYLEARFGIRSRLAVPAQPGRSTA